MKPTPKFGKVVIGILCLILLVFMSAEVAHGHANVADSSHCQLCSAAHLAVGVEPALLLSLALLLLGWVRCGEPSAGARAVLVTAFIRPPPAPFPVQS